MAIKKINVTRWQCTCERPTCKHPWETKTAEKPLICPKCKSASWDRPKVRFFKPKAKK